MANTLIGFIQRNPFCDRPVCTTCGGFLHFRSRLQRFVDERSDLGILLKTITEQDVRDLERGVGELVNLLPMIPVDDRGSVLKAWVAGPARAARFAYHLLDAPLWEDCQRDPTIREAIFDVLLPAGLDLDGDYRFSRRVRDRLADRFAEELADHGRFQRHREFDAAADTRRVELEKTEADRRRIEAELKLAQQREREERTAMIDQLPPVQRLWLIATNNTGVGDPLQGRWAELSDDDVQQLPPELRVALHRYLFRFRRGPWKRLRTRIHAHNTATIAARRAALAKRLGELSLVEQLGVLVESEYPIGYFPKSLAQAAKAGAQALPAELKRRLIPRLAQERRGVWFELRRQVSNG